MGFKSRRSISSRSNRRRGKAARDEDPVRKAEKKNAPRDHAEKKTFDSKYSQLSNGFRNPVRVTFLNSARDGTQRNRTSGFSPGFQTRVIFYALPFNKTVFTPWRIYFRRDHGKNVDYGEKLARFLRRNGIRHGRFMRKQNGKVWKVTCFFLLTKKKR